MRIKAVIWDFGGVFTTSPFERFAAYERENDLPEDFIRHTNAVNPDTNAWARFERSEVTKEEFDGLFLEETTARGHPVPGKDIIALLGGQVRPDMVTALDLILSTDLRCAVITNNVPAGKGPGISTDDHSAQEVAAVMERMELVVESSKLGLRKPDPKIYQHTCSELGIDPSEAVYLDDLGINLKPARELGMTTIKVVDPDQALGELEGVLGMKLR